MKLPVLFALVLLLTGHVFANTGDSFGSGTIVRLHSADPTKNATGTLVGVHQIGNRLKMVILATEHTARRMGTMQKISFGDVGALVGSPGGEAIELVLGSGVSVRTMRYGANGTTDVSLIGLSIDLNQLGDIYPYVLPDYPPATLAVTPAATFTFNSYTYGADGGDFPGFGFRNKFSNQVDAIESFSGSYTTDSANNPLIYTQRRCRWDLDIAGIENIAGPVPGEGAVGQGGAGSPMVVNGAVVGIQLSGSIEPGGLSYGLAWDAADVAWLNEKINELLAGGNELSFLATSLNGVSPSTNTSPGALTPDFSPETFDYTQTTEEDHLTCFPIKLEPGSTLQSRINGGAYFTVDAKPPISTGGLAGGSHSWAIRADGSVASWGNPSHGAASVPANLTNVKEISVGGDYGIALFENGTVSSWGGYFNQQIFYPAIPVGLTGISQISAGPENTFLLDKYSVLKGYGPYLADLGLFPIPAGVTDVIAVANGKYHVLVLKRDGTVAAWGLLGGAMISIPAGLNNVVAIAANRDCSAALRRDGTAVVWGNNFSGQNDIPTYLQGNIVAIAAGDRNILVLYRDGTIGQWGGLSPILPYKYLPGFFGGNLVGIASFYNTHLAQQADGSVTGWGFNGSGVADPPVGLTTARSTATPRMALNPGLNTVEFKVTPASGRFVNTYTLTVNRLIATAPTVSELTAVQVLSNTATLSAVVNPKGAPTAVRLLYSTDMSFDLNSSYLDLGASYNNTTVSRTIGGLNPGTTYHCRMRAANSHGVTYSSPVFQFTTELPAIPTISSLAEQEVLKHGLSLWLDFTVGPGPYADQITVTAVSDNLSLLPVSGIEFDSAATGAVRRLRLKPVCGQTGTAVVTLTATLGSLTATTIFTVNVVDRPPAEPAAIVGLGSLPAFGGNEESTGQLISADGNVVAGTSLNTAFRWTAVDGMQNIHNFSDNLPGPIKLSAISSDGNIIAAYKSPGVPTSYLWDWNSNSFQTLPDPFQINGLTGDGSVAVGHLNDPNPPFFTDVPFQPVRWSAAGGIENLEKSGAAQISATGISSDGSTIVGYTGEYYPGFYSGPATSARYWSNLSFPAFDLRNLDALPDGSHSRANAASADGSVIVGYSDSAAQPGVPKAVRWVRVGFTNQYILHELDNSLSSIATVATAVSADGSRIVGTIGGNGPFGGGIAFVWDAENGQRPLQTAMAHGGASVNAGWASLDEANGISADGLYIVGTGTRVSSQKEAFRAKLPHQPPTPTISAIADVTVAFNTAPAQIPFTLSDVDSNPNCLGVSFAVSNLTLLPVQNVVISGAGANRTITITPVNGLSGQVMIVLTVSDGFSSSQEEFILTVNTPPVALAQSVTTNANTPIEITPTGTDADGQTILFSISTQPAQAQGLVSMTNQKFVFTPNSSFYGSATFLFRAYDGFDFSAPATITVNVLGGLPTVTTLAPSPITTIQVTLRATVQPNLFETRADFIVDEEFFANVIVPAGSTEVQVTKPAGSATPLPLLPTLLPGTAHTCRVDVHSLAGPTVVGNVVNFTMLGGPPMVTTNAPTMITPTKATLHATVNPNEVDTIVTFYIGGIAVGTVNVPAGTTPQTVTFNFTSLIPGQAHTFTANATNTSNQNGNGSNVNFDLLASDSTFGNSNAFLYAANAGWINTKPATSYGFRTGDTVCSGFLYAANFGWIHAGTGEPTNGLRYTNIGNDYGINVMTDGTLRGYAWSGNIGWITFENSGNPRINFATGALEGYAWSGNIGWINLSTATTTQLAFLDTDGDGISDAWEIEAAGNLTTLGANHDTDGDGVSDADEYTADTDPGNPNDRFKVSDFDGTVGDDFVITFPSQPTRFYRIETSVNLAPPWSDVGLGWIQGSATGSTTVNLGNPLDLSRFYQVAVRRPLAP